MCDLAAFFKQKHLSLETKLAYVFTARWSPQFSYMGQTHGLWPKVNCPDCKPTYAIGAWLWTLGGTTRSKMWRSPHEQVFLTSGPSSNVNGTHCLVTSSDSTQTSQLAKPWRCTRISTRVDEHHRDFVAHAVALEPPVFNKWGRIPGCRHLQNGDELLIDYDEEWTVSDTGKVL
jgi:hypothetical protein